MRVVDATNLREVPLFGTEFLHVFAACVAEELSCSWSVCDASGFLHDKVRRHGWIRAILEEGLEGTWEHLFESNDLFSNG